MAKIFNVSLRDDLLARIESIRQEAYQLQKMDESLLLTSLSENKWSVNQCFEHLFIVQKKYIININKGFEKYSELTASEYFNEGFIGKRFYQQMMPITSTSKSMKIKTFKSLKPDNLENSISRFLDELTILGNMIKKAPNQNLEKIRVVSLVGNIMRFKLGDAYRIVIAHNERHLLQANKTIKNVESA